MFDIFNPVNMLDPIRKRFGYGHLWPLRPEGRQNRARSYNYAGSDIPHPIQFRSTKEDLDHFVQNRPGSDLDGLVSGFGQTHLVHKQAGVKEPRGPFLAERSRPRYQFPTFRLGFVLPQTSRTILCKTSPDPI